ncbi:hypothetical protein G7Y89_g13662 [Cudoniella acicularis]|uniref:Sterol regulatory element-binding protein cleavage-activating protein n=1 Tax=Cudoniella acicularis TaxID=354080 RepID=A0A8H4VVU8_9HELO|nr:hypothetical protein G7Y89_g13662 [Cudoniella acicularis]
MLAPGGRSMTTEPPILDLKHPLRQFFTRYGYRAARHPVITLVISVIVAAALIIPLPYLYTNGLRNGTSDIPHHVWASAQPYRGHSDIRPDVVMRSFWVHGSYMKALESDVLQSALDIQNELLGPTIDFNPKRLGASLKVDNLPNDLTVDIRDSLHAINGLSNSSWFFHSPLQYWSCSKENIAADTDIITTVNQHSHQATSVNVTLRHSIVFSGKRFEDRRLVAADALVITLVHMLDSPVGRQWEKRAVDLASRNSKRWKLIPPDGRPLESTLYEFRYQPLSTLDNILLAIAYTVCAAVLLRGMSNLRALKSRVGLIFAVFAQIMLSVLSTFAVCGIFKIHLSHLPRAVYPIASLVIRSQNICSLINAVIVTASNRTTAWRMGEAIGQTGHIALANSAQNIIFALIVWLTASQPASTLGIFCAIALGFDFFFLMTFFAAVLSIDVRRTELSDTLNRVSTRCNGCQKSGAASRKSWAEYIFGWGATASLRIAGPTVFFGVVLMACWHLTDTKNPFQGFFEALSATTRPSPSSVLTVDINQARTPTAWLRMQDDETILEVINVVKPGAHSYIARVYEPIILVLEGSDRTPNNSGVRPFLPAAYDFVQHHLASLIVAIIVLVVAVSLLMKYLLWNEPAEVELDERPPDGDLLTIKTLSKGHVLDVVLLTASNDGVIATVSLDRWVRIWDIQKGIYSYIVQDSASDIDPFPVLAMAIDSDSNWLALLSARDKLIMWNIPERRWGPTMLVEMKGRTPAAFFFGEDKTGFINPLVLVRHNGMMTEFHPEANETKQLQICRSPLVSVRPHIEKPTPECANPPPRIITSSRRGCVHVASDLEIGWHSEGLEIPDPDDDLEIKSILPLPLLSSFLAVRDHTVDLIDIFTNKVTHSFPTQPMKVDSLRCVHSARRRPQCGSVGLTYFAIAYTCAETSSCIIQSYLPEKESGIICFRDPWRAGSKTCCLWTETTMRKFVIENPGRWEALQAKQIVGVRKREKIQKANGNTNLSSGPGLRRRGHNSHREDREEDAWEVWSADLDGKSSSVPLCDPTENENYLLVGGLGPMEKAGRNNIIVALGNIVKVITVGKDKSDDVEETYDALFTGVAPIRKKKMSIFTKKKAT